MLTMCYLMDIGKGRLFLPFSEMLGQDEKVIAVYSFKYSTFLNLKIFSFFWLYSKEYIGSR